MDIKNTPQYKLIHTNDWEIVNTGNNLVVYSLRSHDLAADICTLLNEGWLTLDQLYHEMCYPTDMVRRLIREKIRKGVSV